MDATINKTLKTITKQREQIIKNIANYRKEDECFGCYKYDKVKVRGEETAIKEYKDKVLIGMKCPRCEKEWKIVIIKNEGWKTRFKKHSQKFNKLKKERDNFLEIIK